MHTSVAAVVLGGSQEAAEAAPHRPPASPLAQVEALGQALPLVPAPANLLARQALHDAALDAVAAVGPIPPDCLEACCLRDDLHLFIPAGPARSLLTWARLPLPLLYEGGQFSYPLRQVGLPAPLLQLALNRRASIGWDSCLWHTNLPMLAARSEYAVTLLQLAPGPGGASSRPEQGRQARARSPSKDDGSSDNDASQNAEQQSSSDEWEDDGGGFDLRQLCVVGTRSPTAHTCWQRHLAQQPLLLLQDGTLLEAQLQQDVQVVEAWRPPAGAVPARLQGVLQVAGGAQPRTALLALHNRLSRLDLRSSGGALSLLWQCPQGQHLTAICAPAPAGDASASGADEHLLAATTGTSAPGSGARVLLFDLRRPGQPVATWDQPQLGEKSLEAGTLLRWLPTLQPSAGAAASNSSQQLEAGQPQGGGLLLVGSSGGGQVVGCQFAEQAAGPVLQARGGQIQEKPSTAAAALLERLQASLEQQQQEQQAQDQQAQAGGSAAAQLGTAGTVLLPAPLQPPPPVPLALQLLWQPAHSCTFTAVPPGTPMLLQPPAEQQLALQRWVEAGRLRLQKLSTATGVAIQFGMISEQQKQPHQLAGLAAVAADWATGQGLPVPLLCSLTPRGDVLLSLLREGQGQEAAQQMAAAAAPPLLVPVGQGQPDDADSDDEDQAHSRPAGMQRLPYVRGVPRAVVAAVRDGTLALCGCCRECLRRRLHSCVTRKALRQAGLLKQAGERRGQDPAVVTMPAGDSERSVVQLPLHTALAQRLVRVGAPPSADQPPQQAGQQHAAAALDALLLQLRRSCISLHELQAALQLQPTAEEAEAVSSSSSDEEGGEQASSSVRRAQQAARRQVRQEWRQRQRQERHVLRGAQQAALAALLEGSLAADSTLSGLRGGQAARQALQRRSKGSKRSAAAAAGQHLGPPAAALEVVLQQGELLPPHPPSGLAGEQQWRRQQQQQQQPQPQPDGRPDKPLAALAARHALLREQGTAALRRPSAQEGAAAAAAAAMPADDGSGQAAGQAEWQLKGRSFVLIPTPADGQQQQQQQVGAGQPPAAPRLQVQRGGVAADVLSLVRLVHQEGGASTSAAAAAVHGTSSGAPAPWLCLPAPTQPVPDAAAAALAELRAAWG